MNHILKIPFVGLLIFLYSCSPKINSTIINSGYSSLDPEIDVIVLQSGETPPKDSEYIGDLKIGDSGFSTDCGYDRVIHDAKNTCRKNGANFLEIIELMEPDFMSSCYRLRAKMYRNTNDAALAEFHQGRIQKRKSEQLPDSTYAAIESENDSIIIKNGALGGQSYYLNSKRLSAAQLSTMMKPNEQAFKYINTGRTLNTFGNILGVAGGFMVGYTLGRAMVGGEINWTIPLIGAGLVVVSLPLNASGNKKIRSAVELYNQGLGKTSFLNKTQWKLACTNNGIGIVVNF